MDIAFVNRMLGMTRGGGEIWDLRIAEQLEEIGNDVTFYIGEPIYRELTDPVTEFECVTIPTPHLQDIAFSAPKGVGGFLADIDAEVFCRRASRAIADRGHDFVQVCSRPQFGRYVDQLNIPVSVVMHGEPYSMWHDVLKPGGSTYKMLDAFDAVVAIGETSKLIRERSSADVHTVNPGVDTDQFTPADEKTDGKRILFVGRFVPAKNLSALVRAFDQVREKHPDAELTLIGDGPLRSNIKHDIEDRNLEDAVALPGYVNNHEIQDYYQEANVFVLSSRQENHPITLLEAMSCGVPVVAPKIGWIPYMIEHEREGLVYDSQSNLINALDILLSNTDLQRQYGEYGRTKAIKKFGWEQRATKLNSIYENLTGTV